MGSLKGLRARYLSSFDAKIAELRESLVRLPDDAGARQEMRRRLHTLSGSGEVYGLPDISSWARDVLKVVDSGGAVGASVVSDIEGRIDVLEALVTGLRGDVLADGGGGSIPPPAPDSRGSQPPAEPFPLVAESGRSRLSAPVSIPAPPGSEDWRVASPVKATTKPMIDLGPRAQAAAALPRLADEDMVAEKSGPFALPKLSDDDVQISEPSGAQALPRLSDDDLQVSEPSSPSLAMAPTDLPPPPPLAATLIAIPPAPGGDVTTTRPQVGGPSAAMAAVVESAKRAPQPPSPEQVLGLGPREPARVPTLLMGALTPQPSQAAEEADDEAILPPSRVESDESPVRTVLPSVIDAAPPASSDVAFVPHAAGFADHAEYTVLLVEDAEFRASIRGALDTKRFRLLEASAADEAMEIARQESPDLVVLGVDLRADEGFRIFDQLRLDPLTGFLPRLVLSSSGEFNRRARAFVGGALDYVTKPVDPGDLAKRIERHCTHTPQQQDLPDLGEATLEEVVGFVEREIRKGLLDSAEGAEGARVALGQGTELLATTWNVVGRMREMLARLSNGAVRFRAVDHGRLGVLSLHADAHLSSPPKAPSGPVLDLGGRSALVVDDDPAVRAFFAAVFEEVGARVGRAENGRDALDKAVLSRPDIIVTDILMPEMDGWELCRALRRDFSLRDVPVILLSWKEDFVQRMKELDAKADGYLLKEAQKPAILETVRSVLRPRMLLEQRLSAGGEVTGRIDSVGIVTLLRAVCRYRGDAKLRVRENWNLFEIEVRAGVPVSAVRTSTDGTFRRGPDSFDEIIAVDGGRFTVMPAAGTPRANLTGSIEDLVAASAGRVGALVASVSDAALLRVTGVTFRAEALETYLNVAPERVRDVVRRLSAGQPPTEIMEATGAGPQELERILVDLCKRGAVHAVLSPPVRTETSVVRKLADEERWKVLAQQDSSQEPEILGERAASRPPPEPTARPSTIQDEARKSLAPEPPVLGSRPAPRPARAAPTRAISWVLLLLGGIVAVGLWWYVFFGQSGGDAAAERDGDARIEVEPSLEPEPEPEPEPRPEAVAATAAPEAATSSPAAEAAPEETPEEREARHRRREREREVAATASPDAPTPAPPTKEPPRREAREEQAAAGAGTLAIVAAGGDVVQVIVDDRPRGTTPLQLTLTAGLHEVGLKRGDSPVVFRYVVVREGQEVRLVAPRIP